MQDGRPVGIGEQTTGISGVEITFCGQSLGRQDSMRVKLDIEILYLVASEKLLWH